MKTNPLCFHRSQRFKVSFIFVIIAILCLPFSDLSINTFDPFTELTLFFKGLLSPSLSTISAPIDAVLQTIAFAFLGVAFGSCVGFILSLVFHWRLIQVICAFIRSIHELFWALIFLQIFGLHPITGLLAIGLPYAATFAKVYAEITEEGNQDAYNVIRYDSGVVSAFFYARLPDIWSHIITYTSYRLECGLRSSTVLGFVGLPTLGYYLHTAFLEGKYSEVWALLIIFYILIAGIRYWVRPKLLPFYLLISPFIISNDSSISFENINRFFTVDIIPAPIRNGETLEQLWIWFSNLFINEALPGLINTLVLTQLALVTTGIMALFLFPLISNFFFKKMGRGFGHIVLIIIRSTPEYILAFILLILWGPSMLPAVVALSLHNSAIIAHLIGSYSNKLAPANGINTPTNLYFFSVLPRVYNQFLAFIFYRWEIIMRETAILGILGIATLGFYVDSAIADFRLDKAVILIFITALLNIFIDLLSRYIRTKMTLKTSIDCV